MNDIYAHVSVRILAKEYQVSCPASERTDLLDSAEALPHFLGRIEVGSAEHIAVRDPLKVIIRKRSELVETFLARGMDDVKPRKSPVRGAGVYRDGQYRVVLRRKLGADADDTVVFTPGQMIPIALNIWDVENAEVGKQRAISRWYYLLLEPETPWTTWVWPLVVVVLTAGGEVLGLLTLAVHESTPIERLKSMIYAYPTFHKGVEDAVNQL